MSLRATPEVVAKEMLDTWFATEYEPNEVDDVCIAQVEAIEARYSKS
jgi:hypothetical protein